MTTTIEERERRRVQISGKSSCMVALPKKWVREMGLHQGSEITITRPTFTSLLITSEVSPPVNNSQDAVIEVSEKLAPDSLFREIVSLYVLGYSQVHLRGGIGSFGSEKRDAIKDQVRRHLVGTEVLADSRDGITVHVLLGYSELSVDNALKKMLMITESMCKDVMMALERNDKRLAKAVIQRDEEVGRFGLYVIRQLNMSMSRGILREPALEPRDLLVYTQVARVMDRIASHARTMAEVVSRMPRALPSQFALKLNSTGEYATALVEEALLSLFKRDHGGADLVVEKARRFVEVEDDRVLPADSKDTEEQYTIQALAYSQKRIAEYSRDIAEVVLDLTVERVIRKEAAAYPRVS